MDALIILGLLAGIPLLLSTLFRVNPLFMFVSILTGYLWVQFLGESAELIMRSFIQLENIDAVARIVLMLLPVVLTFLLLRKTLSASALPLYFGLLVMDSLLLVTILVPLLTPGVKESIYQTNAGYTLKNSHDLIISGVAALHLVIMYILRPKSHSSRKHHK